MEFDWFQIELVHTRSGKATRNGRVEIIHGNVRGQFLNMNWVQNLFDAAEDGGVEQDYFGAYALAPTSEALLLLRA